MLHAIIADRSKVIRRVAVSVLSGELHMSVREVSRPDQLLASVDENRPRLLLVALDMASKVGLSQVRKLRLRHPAMNILLLVAAKHRGEEFRDLLAIGATDFLSKPIDSFQLLHRIRVLNSMKPHIGIAAQGTQKSLIDEALVHHLYDPRSGRIDARRVAEFMGLNLKTLAEGLGRNYRTVHKTPSSVSLQPDLQPVRRIIELLLNLVGTKESTLAWLNTPSRDLSGETPIHLIKSGHAESVRSLLENVAAGAPS